jgi:hypothetical protein
LSFETVDGDAQTGQRGGTAGAAGWERGDVETPAVRNAIRTLFYVCFGEG